MKFRGGILNINNNNISTINKHDNYKSPKITSFHDIIQDINISINKILDITCYTILQYKLFTLAFLNLLVEGAQFSLLATMFLPIKNYYNATDLDMKIASSSIFLSIAIGSIAISKFVFVFGRKNTTNICLLIITILHFMLILNSSVTYFTIIRFMLGFFQGILTPIVTNVLCESLPNYFRSFTLLFVRVSFSIGQIITLLLMMRFIPKLETEGILYVYFGLFLISLLVTFFFFLYFDDSPRNMLLTGIERPVFNSIGIRNKGFEMINNLVKLKRSKLEKKEIIEIVKNLDNLKKILSNLKSDDEEFNINNLKFVYNTDISFEKEEKSLDSEKTDCKSSVIKNFNEEFNQTIETTDSTKCIPIDQIVLSETDLEEESDCFVKNKEVELNKIDDGESIFSNEYYTKTRVLIIGFIGFAITYYGPLLIFTPTIQSLKLNSNSDIIISTLMTCIFRVISMFLCAIFSEIPCIGMKKVSKYSNYFAIVFSILAVMFPTYMISMMSFYMMFSLAGNNSSMTIAGMVYKTKIRDYAMGVLFFSTRLGGFFSQIIFLWLFNIDTMLPYYVLVILTIFLTMILSFLDDPSDPSLIPLDQDPESVLKN